MKTFKSSRVLFLLTDHPSWNIYTLTGLFVSSSIFLKFQSWKQVLTSPAATVIPAFFFPANPRLLRMIIEVVFPRGAVHNVIIKPEFNCDTELMMSQTGERVAADFWHKTMEDFVIIFWLKFLTFCVARKHLKTMDPQCLAAKWDCFNYSLESVQRKGREPWLELS